MRIKDKTAGQNVFLGTGDVNFHRVAQVLAQTRYEGTFTFEAPRGADPAATGAFHLTTLRFFFEEAGLLDRPSTSVC